jgi:hypothetical protein
MRIPDTLRKYFWDVDWEELASGAESFEDFIICRVADKGDVEAVRWLAGRFTAKRIGDAVAGSRAVSEKTRRFWKHAAAFL